MAIAFKSAGTGVSTETSSAALSPTCPAVVDANDILILQTAWEGTTTAPSDPAGWTLLYGPQNVGSASVVARHWVYGKIAVGTEDGAAVALGSPAVTTQRAARIFSFSGYVGGTITDVVPAASFTNTVGDTDPTGPTVTTTQAGALACALVYQHDNNTLETFASASDTWTERGTAGGFIFALTPGGVLDLLTATPAVNPGTVSGGAMTVFNDPWSVIGFEIKPGTVLVTDTDSATFSDTGSLSVVGLSVSVLDQFNSATDATSYDIGTNVFAANMLYLLCVFNGNTVAESAFIPESISGTNGLTWEFVDGVDINSQKQIVSVWRAMSTSDPTDGTVVINFAGTQHRCMAQLFEVSGANTSGTNGSGAVVQSKTGTGTSTVSVTLDSAIETGNATFGSVIHNVDTVTASPGTSYQEVGTQAGGTSPSILRFSEWRPAGNTTVDSSATLTPLMGMVALELRVAGTPNVTKSDTDSATLAESAILTVAAAGADSAALTETGSVTATVTHSDSGALAESPSATATVAHADTAVVADATYTLDIPGSDAATLTEAASATATLTASDTLAAAEAATVDLSGSDGATLTDTGSATAVVVAADTGALSEAAAMAAVLAGVDSATATDNDGSVVVTGSNVNVDASDSATLSESGVVSVTMAASDSGTLTESPTVAATVAHSDSGTVSSEAGSVTATLAHADSATISELFASITATLTGLDTSVLTESGSPVESFSLSASDAFVFTETGSVEQTVFTANETGRNDATLGASGQLATAASGGSGVTIGNSGRNDVQVTAQ